MTSRTKHAKRAVDDLTSPGAAPVLIRGLRRLVKEPPLRLAAYGLVRLLPAGIRTKAAWDAVARPQYLTGLVAAADDARRQAIGSIAAIEFGVATGGGLVALESYAAKVEAETGVEISVYGFDMGTGLPQMSGDYRDHPDMWHTGDFRMDESALRRRLKPRTQLIIGQLSDTLPRFMAEAAYPPIGFIAVDLDLYSSTRTALRVLTANERRTLRRVYMYFDDTETEFAHHFAGELLAIAEFNDESASVKIDRWRGLSYKRPFPERAYLQQMYIAHDLEALSRTVGAH